MKKGIFLMQLYSNQLNVTRGHLFYFEYSFYIFFSDDLRKQQICMDIPTVAEIRSAKDKDSKEEQIKRRITINTMKAVMDGTYQEWIEHLTQNTYPEPTR